MPDLIRRNLNKSLKRVFLLPQLFGLFPLKLGSDGFSVSPLVLAATACFLICISVWTIYIVISITSFIRLPLIPFLSVMIRTIFLFFIGACILSSLKCVGKLNHVYDDLCCIDNFLSTFAIKIKDNFTMYFSIACIFLHITLFLVQWFVSKVSLDMANIYLSFVISHAAECQYSGILWIFLSRFSALNSRLKKLRFRKGSFNHDSVILSNVHILLSESLSQVSRLYSLQLLLFTTISLVRCIVFLFSIVFLRHYMRPELTIIIYTVFPFWLLLSFLMFFRVIRLIVYVTREADEFNNLLYQTMLEDKNNELLDNQKLHLHIAMKRGVEFWACGFFKLDYPLVHSMIAATTTYLVILIQFGQMRRVLPVPVRNANTTTEYFNASSFP